MAVDKLAVAINLDTPKDILRLSYASEIRNAALIRDVDPASSSRAAVTTLIAGAGGASPLSACRLE